MAACCSLPMASPVNQEKAASAMALQAKVSSEFSFLQSELIALPDDLVRQYLQDPAVKNYAKFVTDILETKPHRLSPETEEVLAALQEVQSAPYMIYQRTKAADMEFDPIKGHDGEELPMSFALYEDLYESMPIHTCGAKRLPLCQDFEAVSKHFCRYIRD